MRRSALPTLGVLRRAFAVVPREDSSAHAVAIANALDAGLTTPEAA